MPALGDIYLAHPAWVWAAGAAALLALEVGTGSGWLLWPAAAAGVVAVLKAFVPLSTEAAVLIFAALTLVSTFTVRRYFPRRLIPEGHDINDNISRLIGHEGRTVTPFQAGCGRVFIDGKEWAADLADGETIDAGVRVEVTAVKGARLTVRGTAQPAP
jgi:membrane protein implicated in regulation of membrane protease activity